MPDTHAHDLEGIGYHFPGIGQYLNTFFRLKSGNSQDESAKFPEDFLVHRLIAGVLKLQSDCHPMVENLDRP
jgi:hypothetical protein